MKLAVFPVDPLAVYYAKGEIKTRYFNPENFFDEVHVFSRCDQEVDPEKVQIVAGTAKLIFHPIGEEGVWPLRKNVLWPSYWKRVLRLMEKVSPDVIRAYDPVRGGFLAAMAGRRLGIPVVTSVHGDFDLDIRRQNLRHRRWKQVLFYYSVAPFLEKYSLGRSSHVIAVYKFAADYVKRHCRTDVSVIYNRVYGKIFRDVLPALPPSDMPVILNVGRLIKEKNQELLIRSLVGLEARLILVGQGPEKEYLERLAKELGVEERVTFIPLVSHDAIKGYYASAKVYATSIEYGGIAIPVIEAMASGLPLVVVKPQWEKAPELVGDVAMVVNRTPEDFREALKRMLSDSELYAELRARSLRRATEVDGEVMEAAERAIYEKVLR